MPGKILIVDDLRTNRLILREMLKSDYDILEAAGGAEALDILAREYERVSAVLLDISMPGLDGFEVLARIRADQRFSRMPVVMITGSEDQETRVRSLAMGANDFVMKPYSVEILKHCLENNIALREAAATVYALQKDRLTGLWSREAFFQKAAGEIENAPAGHYVLGCVDIDNFKLLNDQYGSEMGDRVLVCLADALRESCVRHGGICGRIFADCFVALYPRALEEAGLVGPKRLEAKITESTGLLLTLSVGRYIVTDKSLSVSAMYDRATIAQRHVKGRYDIRVAVYDESMRSQIVREQGIVNDMRAALKYKQFEVWFQPQYNHASEAVIGAEALVRWRHPQRGLIPPGDFIPVFEQNGFIYTLDKFVWEEVCRCLRQWIDEGNSPLPVSVNVSRYDIFRPDIVETIVGLVERYGLSRDMLRLEITESAFSESTQQIVAVVKELVARGFTVEIDDFGSGYSSLNILKDVPAQIIKLDMRFLKSGDGSQRGGNIIESVVRMAKWLGMSVIAEGVETREEADYLCSIGCNYVQGYLYARPMPAAEYEAHCLGIGKEERLLTLETVENLDNNAFWDPASVDTLIFNSYVGAACIYEYHAGAIELLRATEKYAQMLGGVGMTVEEALRLNWAGHLSTESRARLVRDVEESRATKKEVVGEYVFVDLPGGPHETHLRSTMRVIAASGERYLVYCTNENITAQRQSERRAHETAQQLRSIMENVNGGISAVTVDKEGRVRFVLANDRYYDIFGYTKAQFEAEVPNAMALVHPEDAPRIGEAIARVLTTRRSDSYEYRCIKRDGAVVYLRCNAACTEMTGVEGVVLLSVITDITAEKEAARLRERLMDNLPAGAGIYELRDGQMNLIYQNKRYWELVGLNEAAFPDPTPMSAVHPEDIPLIMEGLSAAIAQGRDVSCDIRLRHLTKGYLPVHLAGRIVPEEDGGLMIYATFTPR